MVDASAFGQQHIAYLINFFRSSISCNRIRYATTTGGCKISKGTQPRLKYQPVAEKGWRTAAAEKEKNEEKLGKVARIIVRHVQNNNNNCSEWKSPSLIALLFFFFSAAPLLSIVPIKLSSMQWMAELQKVQTPKLDVYNIIAIRNKNIDWNRLNSIKIPIRAPWLICIRSNNISIRRTTHGHVMSFQLERQPGNM